MIRAFDFTVEPDTTYRYRVRIVVFNPNYNREDVSPGRETKSEELRALECGDRQGSHAPGCHALRHGNHAARPQSHEGQFEVIRFHPEDGVTVPKRFEAGAG